MGWKLRQSPEWKKVMNKEMTREEIWKKTVADLQTEIHELQMMVVRLQEKLKRCNEITMMKKKQKRMDIIGQNGNDGLHYNEVEDSNLHGTQSLDKDLEHEVLAL